MRLQPVPAAKVSAHFDRLHLGRFELGHCVAPRPVYHGNVVAGTRGCGTSVPDNGTGFADLDGTPFKAYVCATCAAGILGLEAFKQPMHQGATK